MKKARQLSETATDRLRMDVLYAQRIQVPMRRTKYEVWAEILECCIKRTRTRYWLLSNLRLSTTAVKKALNFLLDAKLMEITHELKVGKVRYKTTAKGQEALSIYQLLVTDYFHSSTTKNRTP